MTKQEALEKVQALVQQVSEKPVELSFEQDLRRDKLLDSLGSFVFFMELEKATGLSIPEVESLLEGGWYSVDKICTELANL